MAGREEYIVGKSSQFKEVQEAIDALIEDQGTSNFTADQTITIAEEGLYKPFTIPTASLNPTSVFRLIVRGGPGILPGISGLAEPSKGFTGIDIDVPYVTVEGLVVRDCTRGLFARENALGLRLGHCIARSNTNVGFWIYTSDNAFLYNLIAHGSKFGIVGTRVRNFACFYATIMTDPSPETAKACLFVTSNILDPGTITLRNNCLAAYSGTAILLGPNDLLNIDSDYNNFYSPTDAFGLLKENNIKSVAAWTLRTNLDHNSIAVDPRFIKRTKTNKSVWIDLNLLEVSPLRDRGEDAASGSYTSNVDTLLLAKDFFRKNRDATPTIGAHEVLVSSDGFGDEVFRSSAGSDPCGDIATILDLGRSQFAEAVKPWYPQLRTGYFYVRDQLYYLYAEKIGRTLTDITSSEFTLTNTPVKGTVSVIAAGTEVTNWNVRGPTFVLEHKGLPIVDLCEEVKVEYSYLSWSTGDKAFSNVEATDTFRLSDGTQRYILDPAPQDCAPVVITDDTIKRGDDTGDLPFGFTFDYSPDIKKTEIELRITNLVDNPQFNYINSDDTVASWETSGTLGLETSQSTLFPKMGTRFMKITSGSILDVIPTSSGQDYTLSTYLVGLTGEETVTLGFNLFGATGESLGSSSSTVTALQLDTGEHGTWSRYSNTITSSTIGAASILEFYISATGETAVDCVQVETTKLTNYNRLPRPGDITVEWEASNKGVYEIEDLNLNPVANPNTSGFLAIQNVPANQLDKTADTSYTILNDWDWTKGRTQFLPWAKVSGLNKWNPLLRSTTRPAESHAGYTNPTPTPDNIVTYPSPVQVVQGSGGDEVTVEVYDTAGNPYAFGDITCILYEDTGEFPGHIASREFGYYTAVGQKITKQSNTAGAISLRVVPPELEDISVRGIELKTAFGPTGELLNYIETKYEVSHVGHGDPRITNLDGSDVSLIGSQVSETLTGHKAAGVYHYALSKYPYLWSTSVSNDSVRLIGSFSPTTLATHYHIDYDSKTITTGAEGPLTVSYLPRLAWKDPNYKRRIYIDTSLSISIDAALNYDVLLHLSISATANGTTKFIDTPVIAMHSYPATGEI